MKIVVNHILGTVTDTQLVLAPSELAAIRRAGKVAAMARQKLRGKYGVRRTEDMDLDTVLSEIEHASRIISDKHKAEGGCEVP